MIIKPVCNSNYVLIPNSLIYDRQLSIETRGMLVYLLAKPTNWKLLPIPLATDLARLDECLGWKRLARMKGEAIDAGYIARSTKQIHDEDGSFGSYEYIVGMPEDVADAAAKAPDGAFSSHCREAHASEARARASTIYKVKSQKSKKDRNYEEGLPEEGCDELSPYGIAAQNAGLMFVWDGSKPFRAWIICNPDLPTTTETVAGKRVRGVWRRTLYPPAHSAPGLPTDEEKSLTDRDTESTALFPASMTSKIAAGLINQIMAARECSRDDAIKILSALPDSKPASE